MAGRQFQVTFNKPPWRERGSLLALMDEAAVVRILAKMDKAWALAVLERLCEGDKSGPWTPGALPT